MSKPFMISVALSALIVTAAPAMAQRHPGPSNLRDADHAPPTTVIAVPSLIRSRATPNEPATPGDNSGGRPHVKVFDGANLRAGEPQPQAAPQPDGEESAAARMRTQNNLKQMGLAAH